MISGEENEINSESGSDSSLDDDEELERCPPMKSSVWQDLSDSLHESRYVSLLALFLGLYLGYSITIAPYQLLRRSLTPEQRSLEALKYVRPVLSADQIQSIYSSTLYAETFFELPEPYYDKVKIRFQSKASKFGHFRLPDMFYEGVTYGLTWQNSHRLEYYRHGASFEKLKNALNDMEPCPTHVFLRSSQNNVTNWSESGFAVHFSNSDLNKQGMLSSDASKPWKRTEDAVMNVAREFKLAYIFQWYPHHFGAEDIHDPYKHAVIIQQIIPTRTGLNGIKSTATVWLSSVNYSEPTTPPKIVRKEWTDDDHWSSYALD